MIRRIRRGAGRSQYGAAALLGAIAALGHAPFDLWPITVVALAGVASLSYTVDRPRRLGWTFWAAGAGYFAVALHWIVEPFLVDAARHGWMAPFALLALAAGLALFWGAAGTLAAWLCRTPAYRMPMAMSLLVAAEMARAEVLTGFPWAHPGHVLIASDMLGLAAWIGPHGLTLAVVSVASLLAWFAVRRRWVGAACVLLGFVAAGAVPGTPPAPQPRADAPVIRLIQPNAPQDQKWLPDMIPVFFDRGLALTATPPEGAAPDLVIWPETSLPVLLDRSDTARWRLAQASGGAPVIIGAQRYDGDRAANSLALIAGDGTLAAVYDKHHLVPFGEYLPFDDALSRLGLRGLAAMPIGYRAGDGPGVLDLGPELGRSFAMICYEAIFPEYIRRVPRPEWIVHITNDAWFGSFSGPYQHLALARLRAAEQGLPVLRSANTGISAVIDARGRIVADLPLGQAGYLDAVLPAALPATPFARWGDWPVSVLVVFVTVAIGLRARRRAPLRPDA